MHALMHREGLKGQMMGHCYIYRVDLLGVRC